MKDTWCEVSAYIRKKAKTTLTDKIAQVRKQRIDADENNSDISDKDEEDNESSDNEDWDEVKSKADLKKKNKKTEIEEKSEGMVKIENEII